jgi:predicted ATPase with chaperone activity
MPAKTSSARPSPNGGGFIAQKPASAGAWVHVDPAPRTIAEAGLPLTLLEDLALKVLRSRDRPGFTDVVKVLAVHQQLCQEVIDGLVRRKLASVESADSLMRTSFRYGLTEEGKAHADDAMRRCAYIGAAPVPIDQYTRVVRAQQQARPRPTPETVREALAHLVLPEVTVESVGQAFSSGRPLMVHGPSGTGKTDMVVSVANAMEGSVLMPQALYGQGQIIEVLDAHLHVSVLNPDLDHADIDRRWREIKRPVAVAGGEMSAEAMELTFDSVRRTHVAPLSVRAQGGVLIVDDLGRQRISLNVLLNRWIQLMENGADTFALQSSEIITLPLDATLVFSTNLALSDLMDEAYLRRITYKIPVKQPSPDEFRQIAARACETMGVVADEESIAYLTGRLYSLPDVEPMSCYARDLVQTVIDTATYYGRPVQLDRDVVDWSIQLYLGERGRDRRSSSRGAQ